MARVRRLAVTVQDAAHAANTPSPQKLRAWARHALGKAARGELTLRIVDEDESAALNQQYRGTRGPTNVLSFAADRVPGAAGAELLPLGDLVICATVVQREAREQRKPAPAHW